MDILTPVSPLKTPLPSSPGSASSSPPSVPPGSCPRPPGPWPAGPGSEPRGRTGLSPPDVLMGQSEDVRAESEQVMATPTWTHLCAAGCQPCFPAGRAGLGVPRPGSGPRPVGLVPGRRHGDLEDPGPWPGRSSAPESDRGTTSCPH